MFAQRSDVSISLRAKKVKMLFLVRLIKSFFRFFVTNAQWYRTLHYRLRFRGLSVSSRATLCVEGSLKHAQGVSIGEGANLIVPSTGQLRLERGAYLGRHVEVATHSSMRIGRYSSIQDFSVVVGSVDIGAYCLVSYGVMLTSGVHYHKLRPHWLIRDQDELVRDDRDLASAHERPIRIEDDCWLGAHSVVMPGVCVAKGCVVGANSVVTRDLPPYSIAVGAPATVVSTRLEFRPPTNLRFDRDEDLPYFYAGFGVGRRDRARGAASGGHFAGKSFSLALNCRNASTFHAKLRSLVGDIRLLLGGDVANVSQTWTNLEIQLPPGANDRLLFEVETASKIDELIVFECAWVV